MDGTETIDTFVMQAIRGLADEVARLKGALQSIAVEAKTLKQAQAWAQDALNVR